MRNIDNLKEHYRLWVEYLKESGPYKEYCDKHRTSKELKASQIYWLNKREVYDLDYRTANDPFDHSADFSKIYRRFGDIHSPSYNFDIWWETVLKGLTEQHKTDPYMVTKIDCSEMAHDILSDYEDLLNEPNEAEQRLAMALFEYMGEEKGNITLKFNTYHPTDELVERLKVVIEGHKNEHGISSDTEKQYLNFTVPTIIGKRLASEISLYLDIYRKRKEGKKWKEVIKEFDASKIEIHKGKERPVEDARRVFLGYHAKAEKIIRNVEQDIFPGNYQ